MAQFNDGLSTQQAFALISETTSARNLLGHGLWSLRNAAFMETMLDPIMTMLSIGLEKMMKMSLGLISVADDSAWPPHSRFQYHWRHDLTLMNAELLPMIRERLPLATHRAVIEPKLEAVENDAAWDAIVVALTRFGVSGRFFYLDQLADRPQSGEDPKQLWDEAEQEMMQGDPALNAEYQAVLAGPLAGADIFYHQLESRMAQSIQNYWELLCYSGMHRMLGERGVSWGTDSLPDMVGRQVRQ